jgi:glyoxylase-like metal-dependent hydrolase (beta-lactamase superfamily II)
VVDVADDDPAQDWTTPGVYSVAPGVFRIPLPLPTDGLRAVNVYALVEGDDLVLIDSGWAIPEARELLSSALGALDRHLGDVRRFLVTHVHRDHYTQAVVLRREFGTPIALGAGEKASIDIVTGLTPLSGPPFVGRLRLAGADEVADRLAALGRPPASERKVWEAPDEWLADRSTATVGERSLTAVQTPGHTRGHLVFVDDAAGLLFAGDHVLPHITPSIGFESAPSDFPLRDYMDSLRMVRAMPDTRLLPAHGPVSDSTHRRVDELLEHHDRRLAEIHDIVVGGAATAFEAARILKWTRRLRSLSEMDPFNEMLAVLETLSHLDVLVLQGRLRRADVDGVLHYQVA